MQDIMKAKASESIKSRCSQFGKEYEGAFRGRGGKGEMGEASKGINTPYLSGEGVIASVGSPEE